MPDDALRIGADDEVSGAVFGISSAPAVADLHAFPLDDRGRALEAARRARFPSAPVVTETLEAVSADDSDAPAAAGVWNQVDAIPVAEVAESAPAIVYLPGGPGITVVPLQHPFLFGEREVREICVPPLTSGLKADFAEGLVPDMLTLVGQVTGEPLVVVRALRAPDDAAVEAAVRTVLTDEMVALLERAARMAELAILTGA